MKRIGFLLALFIPAALSAQERMWTLEDCIRYGLDHNITVKQYELTRQNQELTLETSKYSRLPNLSAGLGETFYFGRTPNRDGVYQDQTGSNSSFNVNAGVNLFSGFRVHNQIKANQLDLEASVADLSKAKEDLALNIAGYYLQVLLNKELCSIADEQLNLSIQQVEQTQALVDGGKATESELFDAQAELAQQQLSLTRSQNDLNLALLSLTQALSITDSISFDVVVPDVEQMVVDEQMQLVAPRQAYSASLELRPAIAAAQSRLESSRRTLKVAQSAYYPSLNLGVGYSNSYYYNHSLATGMSNASLADQWAQNGAESIGLSLSIPIFNRMATRNQVRASRLNIQNQQLQLQQVQLDLFQQVQQAYYNAVAAHESYVSAQTAVEAARRAFDAERLKFTANRSNSYTFNQVRLRLEQSLSQLAQAKYTFLFRSKILAFYNGTSLTETSFR